MTHLIFKQFELTRSNFLKAIETISEELLDHQPKGFNNTIHWNIGHVLTLTEQFMFRYPKKSTNIPANYKALFGYGTKPSDWQGNVPSLEQLTEQLKDQLIRIKKIPNERLTEKLEKPFLGFETFGEVANMSLYHEAYHLGQIHVMKRMIEK